MGFLLTGKQNLGVWGPLAFQTFDKIGLDEFIRREAAPDALWIFMHIPKTAGSSFADELSNLRPPYRNIHVDYEDQTASYDTKLDRAIDDFVSDAKTTSFRSCSGHLTARHILKVRQSLPDARVLSLLRHPVQRVVSDFRYARTHAHPPYQEFIKEFPTIDSYVRSPVSQDKMFKFMAPDPNILMSDFFDFLGGFMSFVGITEMYPMSFNIATRLFGMNQLPRVQVRRTEPTEANHVQLTPDLVTRIQRANFKDCVLYNRIMREMSAKHGEWLASRNRAFP